MSDKSQDRTAAPASYGRRSFLFSAAGAGLAGAAVVTGIKQADEPAPEAQAEPDGQGQGYRLTGHIQRYYRSTRL